MHEFPLPSLPNACPQCKRAVADAQAPFCVACKFDLRYGKVKRPASGKCIYCDYEGPLTEEHVFGKWLTREFGRASSVTSHTLGRPSTLDFWNPTPYHRVASKPTQGDLFDLKVSNVCGTCNNGWMSDVHAAAKSLITHLAAGKWQVHTEAECESLTRWIIMVTINLESHSRIPNVPRYQREALKNGGIPDGWEVGFGTLQHRRRSSYFQSGAVPIHVEEGVPLYVNNANFCIEHAIFHSRSSFGDAALHWAQFGGGLSARKFPTTRLWPSAGRTVEDVFRGINLSAAELRAFEP